MYRHHHAFRVYPRNPIAHPQSSPLSRLPVELLVHIFLLTSPGATRWSTNVGVEEERKNWVKLMAVCSLWRDIICNAAVFWTSIHVGRDLRWLELSLTRTQQARNIDISIPLLTDKCTSAMDIMEPYASRIRSLVYLHGECEEFTSSLNVWPAPALGSLSIVNLPFYGAAKHQRGYYPTIQLSAEQQPFLHTLSLSGFTISEDQVMLSRLVSLSLSGWPGGEPSGLLMSELIAVLGTCVSLRDLAIVNYLGRSNEYEQDIPQGTGPVISLPHLRNFKIEHREVDRVSNFLSHMTLPAHVNISITTTSCRWLDMVDVLPDAEWRDRLAILQCVDRIKVVGDFYVKAEYTVLAMQDPATCAPGTAPGRIKIVMRDANGRYFQNYDTSRAGPSANLLQDLPKIFPALHMVKTLTFSGNASWMIRENYWTEVLRHYPSLRTLVVEDALCKTNVPGLMEVLGADVYAPLLCPRLEYLWLRNMGANKYIMSATTAMVRGRAIMKVPLHRLRLELATWSEVMWGALTHEEFYAYEPRVRMDVGRCEMKLWEGQKSDDPQRFEFANLDIAADLDVSFPFN